MEFDGFDWDHGNWPKCGKHGVGREEIEAAFGRPDVLVLRDKAHDGGEDRFLLIVKGRTNTMACSSGSRFATTS